MKLIQLILEYNKVNFQIEVLLSNIETEEDSTNDLSEIAKMKAELEPLMIRKNELEKMEVEVKEGNIGYLGTVKRNIRSLKYITLGGIQVHEVVMVQE